MGIWESPKQAEREADWSWPELLVRGGRTDSRDDKQGPSFYKERKAWGGWHGLGNIQVL